MTAAAQNLDAALKTLVQVAGFPAHLVPLARKKVTEQIFDGQRKAFHVRRRHLLDESMSSPRRQHADPRGLVATAVESMEPGEDVWLVAHSWSFPYRDALEELRNDAVRMSKIGSLLFVDDNASINAEIVFENLWRVAIPLPARNQNGDTLWIVPDDLGAALSHSTQPVARLATMMFEGGAICLLWLTDAVQNGAVITVDRSPAVPAQNDGSDGLIGRVLYGDQNEVKAAMKECEAYLAARDNQAGAAPLVDIRSANMPQQAVYEPLNTRRAGLLPLKVCTDSRLVQETLTDAVHFTITTTADEADIMWLCHYKMKSSDEFPNASFVSQLPEERCFINKAALARTVQRGYGYRTWHPDTYECPQQLPAFIAAFERRRLRVAAGIRDGEGAEDEVEEHNLWIVKAPELTRGMDMCISGNLNWLVKHCSECGPRIVQVYISRPLLFRQRKFDVRYYLMLRSTLPLEAYVHKTFVIRLAAEEYEPTEVNRFDRHWTVSRDLGQGTFPNQEFIEEFERDRAIERNTEPRAVWRDELEPRVYKLLRELCMAIQPHVHSAINRERFRGLYAADILFTSRGLQPRLLEMNYSPDNNKILSICPGFHNDVFRTLFLGRPTNCVKLYLVRMRWSLWDTLHTIFECLFRVSTMFRRVFTAPRPAVACARWTTILCVRKGDTVVLMGDKQVTLGERVVAKSTAKKLRRSGDVMVGFAGSTADALTLMEKLEGKITEFPNQLTRACVELAKEWRGDKMLRRLEASLIVCDKHETLEIDGAGNVITPEEDGIVAIGSGGQYAKAAARALIDVPDMTAEQIAEKSMRIATDLCCFSNSKHDKDVIVNENFEEEQKLKHEQEESDKAEKSKADAEKAEKAAKAKAEKAEKAEKAKADEKAKSDTSKIDADKSKQKNN
jgi:ATP-dependent protease HslVU peptidase subunit